MAEGGDAEDEIQFLRTVRLCFSVRMCVCVKQSSAWIWVKRVMLCVARRVAPRPDDARAPPSL